MTDWQAEARDAAADLAEEGFTAILRKRTDTGGTFYAPTHSEADQSITVVQDVQRVRDGSGTLTERTVRTLYAAATGPEISKGDAVVIGGVEHGISEVRPVAPGGVVVLYELDLAD